MPRISTDNYDTIASWNGSQDLFVVEQTDGTKVATPEQIKQYVLGNSIDDVYSVMGQNGAKNLIPCPYVNTSQTINNVEFTVNGDGSISVDNAASETTQFRLYGWTTGLSPLLLRKGTYILSGCPSDGGVNSLRLYLHNQNSSITIADDGEETQFTLSDDTYVGIAIRVANGYDADGKTVYPMLRYASDTDDTYQPYAKTNRQLTEVIGDLSQTGLTGDSVAAQLGAAKGQISRLTTPTLLWEGDATAVGTTYNMTRKYSDFKYLLVLAKTNVEVKTILIPTSSISATAIFPDVLSAGTWNATDKAFAYNSSYGIKFTAANKFKLDSLSYNNSNWILRPRAIYGIG